MRYFAVGVFLCLVVASLALFSQVTASRAVRADDDGGGGGGGGGTTTCYSVTTSTVGDGTTDITGTACESGYSGGTSVEITATAGTDAKFEDWTGDCTGSVNPFDIANLNDSYSCIAHFVNCHTVTLDGAPLGEGAAHATTPADCDDGGYGTDTDVSIEADPVGDNEFAYWSGDGTCDGLTVADIFTMPDHDVSCTANFTVCHEVDVSTDGNGVADLLFNNDPCTGGAYDGATIEFEEAPNYGYYFQDWEGPCAGQGDEYIVYGVTSDMSCTADYLPCSVLDVQYNGPGTASDENTGDCGDYNLYYQDSSTYLDASPDSGAYFNGWSGDCSGYDSPYYVTFETSKSCTADFEP